MFTHGFEKIAYDGTNNQGLEFKNSDTNNSTANVGPGGMAPQGLETYEPTGSPPKKEVRNKKTKKPQPLDENETAQFLISKYAKVNERLQAGTSRATDGIASGLKKDTETADATQEEQSNTNKEMRAAYLKYKKAEAK